MSQGPKATQIGQHLKNGTMEPMDDFRASVDEKGVFSASESFTCSRFVSSRLIPSQGAQCTREGYNFLFCSSVEIEHIGGDVDKITVNYKGIQVDNSFTMNDDEEAEESFKQKTYSCRTTTNEESLFAHPDFKDMPMKDKIIIKHIVNGRFEPKKNDALAEGVPEEWVDTQGDPNVVKEYKLTSEIAKKALKKYLDGKFNYLSPGVIWQETFNTKGIPSGSALNSVGKIGSPPNAPQVSQDRNWLVTGIDFENVAGVDPKSAIFRVTRNWMLSGPGGWDSDVYK